MNCFAGYVRPVFGGYWAMLRFASDAKPSPVLTDGGAPVVYETECEAWKAVTAHLLRYFNGNLRRDGETLTSVKAAANAVFRKGRMIPVETAGRAGR